MGKVIPLKKEEEYSISLKGIFAGLSMKRGATLEETMEEWDAMEGTPMLNRAALHYCVDQGLIRVEQPASTENP